MKSRFSSGGLQTGNPAENQPTKSVWQIADSQFPNYIMKSKFSSGGLYTGNFTHPCLHEKQINFLTFPNQLFTYLKWKTLFMGAIKLNNYSSDVIRNSELGRAIGAPARITILKLIHENSRITGPELLRALELYKATIYQHVEILIQSGLIVGTFEENLYCWKLNPDTTNDFQKIKWALSL